MTDKHSAHGLPLPVPKFILVLAMYLVGGCGSGDPGGRVTEPAVPGEIVVRYSVSYSGTGESGSGIVTYARPGGASTTETVSLPWASGPLIFVDGESASIRAEGSERDALNLQCDIVADEPPAGRTASATGLTECAVRRVLGGER